MSSVVINLDNYLSVETNKLTSVTIDSSMKEETLRIFLDRDLSNLTTLCCDCCVWLTSIPDLPNLTELRCNRCTGLTSIPELPNLTNLVCSGCTMLDTIPVFPNLTRLKCNDCVKLTVLPELHNLTSLTCTNCDKLDKISELPNLTNLICDGCSSLINLPPLLSLKSIYYSNDTINIYTIPLWLFNPITTDVLIKTLEYNPQNINSIFNHYYTSASIINNNLDILLQYIDYADSDTYDKLVRLCIDSNTILPILVKPTTRKKKML